MIRGLNCYYMEHGLELIIARLEIFVNLIFDISSYPGNIGNRVFLIFWSPGNIGNWIFLIFWPPGNIGDRVFLIAWYPGNTGGGRAAPGVRLRGLGLFSEHVSWNFRMSWKYWKYILKDYCCRFSPKDACRNFTQNPPMDVSRSLV